MAFKKKVKVLSHTERIEEAKGKLQAAQNMFVQARSEVDAADEELDKVVAEAQAKINQLQETVASANVSKDKNAKFKAKIAEFIELD